MNAALVARSSRAMLVASTCGGAHGQNSLSSSRLSTQELQYGALVGRMFRDTEKRVESVFPEGPDVRTSSLFTTWWCAGQFQMQVYPCAQLNASSKTEDRSLMISTTSPVQPQL